MAKEKSLIAKGLVPMNKLPKFVHDIGTLDTKDFCDVLLEFNNPECIGRQLCFVIITAHTPSGAFFLEESLTSGMLHHWGWTDIFKLEKPSQKTD